MGAPQRPARPIAFVIVSVGLTLAICWFVPPPGHQDEAGVALELPFQVGDTVAFTDEVTPAEREILPPDTIFARKAYGRPESSAIERIHLSIVLSGRERRSIHQPERCLPGQGFQIENGRDLPVDLASGRRLNVRALYLARPVPVAHGELRPLHTWFRSWFVSREVSTPDQFTRIWRTNWDLLVHRRIQRWAYVSYAQPVLGDLLPGAPGAEATLERIKTFIRATVPAFVKSEMAPEGAPARPTVEIGPRAIRLTPEEVVVR